MKSTLQSKIAVAMWVMTAVSTLAAAILTGGLLVTSHREAIRQQLQATATSLVSLGITHFSELKDFEELNRFVEDALQMDRIDKIIRVYDGSKRLIFTTAGTDYDMLPEKLANDTKKPIFLTVEGKQRRYESIVMPYEGVGSRKTFYLQVVIPLPKYFEVLGYLWWQSILMIGFLIGISVILSHWLSKRLLKPVETIAVHLREMDPAKIEEWKPMELDPRGRYLKAIADGINLMAERTRVSIMQLKKMSRYVAHEMRTPLTILQGEAETVLLREDAAINDYERVLRSSLEEIQRMSEIVNTVLRVGEDAMVAPFHQPVSFEIGKWLAEHKKDFERSLERAIETDIPQSAKLSVMADPKLLHRLVDNLVRNVKNHTPPQSICKISVEAAMNQLKIIVEDNGPGLSSAIIDSLNEEGRAADAAGVGLNLCYRIAEISGFKLHFSNKSTGGLKAEIIF